VDGGGAVRLARVVLGWYVLAQVGRLNAGLSAARWSAGRWGVMTCACWRGWGAALMVLDEPAAMVFAGSARQPECTP